MKKISRTQNVADTLTHTPSAKELGGLSTVDGSQVLQ